MRILDIDNLQPALLIRHIRDGSFNGDGKRFTLCIHDADHSRGPIDDVQAGTPIGDIRDRALDMHIRCGLGGVVSPMMIGEVGSSSKILRLAPFPDVNASDPLTATPLTSPIPLCFPRSLGDPVR